jgi:hypothetical protein
MKSATAKIKRLQTVLSHREPDQVPAGEFFWTGFMNRCRVKWGKDFDPYRHFDLDYIVITPNMDPRIQAFQIVSQSGEDIVVKTGFGATIRRSGDKPLPHYETFSVPCPEAMADYDFDDPVDLRRFHAAGDDQINCVGDALHRNLPAWTKRLDAYEGDFALFGSVCEPYEYLWRCIGTENALLWLAEEPELMEAFINRIGSFLYRFAEAQIIQAKGRLCGMYIWGDVAYRGGMLFSPATWRRLFKPHVKNLIDLFHKHQLMVIYHGCGDTRVILQDFVDMGLDAYNPLEAKAGLDVVSLKKQYGNRLAFCGNIDMRVLEKGDPSAIESEVSYKLQAARGGGWIFQSDHSISSDVTPESYELAIKTLRRFGNYPLNL